MRIDGPAFGTATDIRSSGGGGGGGGGGGDAKRSGEGGVADAAADAAAAAAAAGATTSQAGGKVYSYSFPHHVCFFTPPVFLCFVFSPSLLKT